MEDTNQVLVPESFLVLYKNPRSNRLVIAWDDVCTRYEHCEDLSMLLVDTASSMMHSLKITEFDVITRIHAGLIQPQTGTTPSEAFWILNRLLELLGWSFPLHRFAPQQEETPA